jgi:FkbM family methyltransferase
MIFDVQASYDNWVAVLSHFISNSSSKDIQLKLKKEKCVLTGLSARLSPIWLSALLSNRWDLIGFDDTYLYIRNKEALSFKLRRLGSDLGTLVEAFLDMPYGSNFDGQTVVDIGMSIGDSAIFFATQRAKKVIGVEPCLQTFRLAEENICLNGLDTTICPLNCGIGPMECESIMRQNLENPTVNNVLGKDFAHGCENTERIRMCTLSQVVKENGLTKIDFLKMDCEGYEYEILRSLDMKTYSIISSIGLEFHNGLQDIPKILSAHGFIFDKCGKERGMLLATRKKECEIA